jgi:hypothetical protein
MTACCLPSHPGTRTHRLAVLRAELEDMPHFDRAPDLQWARRPQAHPPITVAGRTIVTSMSRSPTRRRWKPSSFAPVVMPVAHRAVHHPRTLQFSPPRRPGCPDARPAPRRFPPPSRPEVGRPERPRELGLVQLVIAAHQRDHGLALDQIHQRLDLPCAGDVVRRRGKPRS